LNTGLELSLLKVKTQKLSHLTGLMIINFENKNKKRYSFGAQIFFNEAYCCFPKKL
jgi:hypothetical protein